MKVILFVVICMFVSSCATSNGALTAETMCSKTDADPLRIYSVSTGKTRKTRIRHHCYQQEEFKNLDACPGLGNRFCRVNWEEIRKGQSLSEVTNLIGEPDEVYRKYVLRYSDQGERLGSVKIDKEGAVESFEIELSRGLPVFEGPRISDEMVDIKLIILDYDEIKSNTAVKAE